MMVNVCACMSLPCACLIIKVFAHTFVFYGRLYHITQAVSHSFLVCVSLQAAGCFQEKLQECDRGREKQCVLSTLHATLT